MNTSVIVSENKRPMWQICIAAGAFTLAFGVFLLGVSNAEWSINAIKLSLKELYAIALLVMLGISFSSHKRVYIDLKQSRFKPSVEIGPLKIGQWHSIKNYEYVSVFVKYFKDGSYKFEVNLWYDKNKHLLLYENNDYKAAFIMGFDLSEELDIALLDATTANDYKWIDKVEWRNKMQSNT